MASGPHTFATLSQKYKTIKHIISPQPVLQTLSLVMLSRLPVFSPERYQGNPLAVVAVRGNALSQQRKSLIAKEFGYSETVFIHDAPGPNIPRRVDIFTEKGEEIPFAGHPVIGVAHYIFHLCPTSSASPNAGADEQQRAVIMTKAGPIPIFYNEHRQVAACSVPHKFHLHSQKLPMEKVVNVQPQIQIVPTFEKCKDKSFAVASIVKGMTFALIDLTETPDILGGLAVGKAPEVELDPEWSPSFVGALYYRKKDAMIQNGEPTIQTIQARMITQGFEDPGTGSACCTLACYLALHDNPQKVGKGEAEEGEEEKLADGVAKVKLENSAPKLERRIFAIQQGVEMGRKCMIAVEVDVEVGADGGKKIAHVTLSGRAIFFTSGELMT